MLVAGKGHEKTQVIGKRKIYFSDKKIILKAIKIKNKNLSNNLKLNILKEISGHKKFPSSLLLKKSKNQFSRDKKK